MDVLGNRGGYHLAGRRVAVFNSDDLRGIEGIFAHNKTAGQRSEA